MRTYDAMPLKPFHEDSKQVLYNELNLQRYSMAELVEKAIEGNANCREWLGHSIERRAPRIIPPGYRYDPRNGLLIPPGFAYCTGCKQMHLLSAFGTDERSTGRGGTKSKCRAWESEERRLTRRKKAFKKWKRG